MTQLSRPQTSGGGEAVKVIVRCRPLSKMEIAQGHQSIVTTESSRGVVEVKVPKEEGSPAKCFTFDSVYGNNSKQIDLYYEGPFRDLVDSVLQGFNGTIFAYGQTGTGKTFTMEGVRDNPELRGVIPNAIDHIFRHIAQSKNQQYLVRASYLEIYQEEIRDLLDKDSKKRLELKERPDIGVYVKDLSSFVTKSVQEIEHVMSVGHSNRSVGCTNMNEHSSRSHAIFIITVECSELGLDGENHIRVGRLNLVDLAGSERQTKTGAVGERFKEATKINLSLSALGNVISALVDSKSSHIPYRDSKLTRLLQDSLGGNSKTIMIANIGPASYNYEETISTLRYASRAKNIKNKPKINEDPKDALLREFQDEINRLKNLLEKRSGSGTTRRRRRHRHDGDGQEHEGIDEINPEDYIREQQLKLKMEREEVLKNNSIVEQEKCQMLAELEERSKQLTKEREAQVAVAAKIRAMQSKLLSGDGNLLDQTRQQQEILQQKRIELAEQKRREREIAQQLEAQEDNTAEIKQTFVNLQQEIELKSRKLQKFLTKHQQIRLELEDSVEANSRERQSLESSVSEMNKELKLKWMLIENFIPMEVVENLKERAFFDEEEEKWVILKSGEHSLINKSNTYSSSPFMRFSGEGESRLTTSVGSAVTRVMVDSGLDSGVGTSGSEGGSSSCPESGPRIPTAQLKRPVSVPGLRRPICNFERHALDKLRQRCVRSAHNPASALLTQTATTSTAPQCMIPEEVARFGCENLLTFNQLIFFPSQVHSTDPSSLEESGAHTLAGTESASVVIETSKIPIPRTGSRGSRRSSSIAPSLHSKKRACPQRAWKATHNPPRISQSTLFSKFSHASDQYWSNSSSSQSSHQPIQSQQSIPQSQRISCRRKAVNRSNRTHWLTQLKLNQRPEGESIATFSLFYNQQQRLKAKLANYVINLGPSPASNSLHVNENQTAVSSAYKDQNMNKSNTYYDDNETIVFLHENILNMDCSVLTSIENANSKSRQVLESTTNASPREARKLVPSRIPTPMFRSLTESSAKLMERSNHRHSSIQSNTSNICENIMPVSYSYPLLVEDVPCGSCEQLAEDLVRSPLRESQLLLSRIHQRPLVKRSYCRRPRALIQPLHHTTSNFTRYQRNSSVSSDFKELNCNNLETVQPVRECDKYKNSFGGFIRPVEKLVRLYGNKQSKCRTCRFEIAVFRRIQRLQSHSRTRRGKGIAKPFVCRPDPCRCSFIKKVHKNDQEKINKPLSVDTAALMNYAVLFAGLAFVLRLIDSLFLIATDSLSC